MSPNTLPPSDAAPSLLPPLRDPLFDAMREELAGHVAPPGVRKELLAAFANHHAKQNAARHWWRRLGASGWALLGCGAGGVAALALLLVVMMAGRAPLHDSGPALVGGDDSGPFIALDSFERIEQDPAPRVLATTVPRASLTALGVAVSPENAGDMVKAEMLVGADGSPLALRLAFQ